MSKRTICTCDICGKDIEPVLPIRFIFDGQYRYIMCGTQYAGIEELEGDACKSCLRSIIEELRNKYDLKYTIREALY